jgi:hypothetical protein
LGAALLPPPRGASKPPARLQTQAAAGHLLHQLQQQPPPPQQQQPPGGVASRGQAGRGVVVRPGSGGNNGGLWGGGGAKEKMSLVGFTKKCMKSCATPGELERMKVALHARITKAISMGEVTKDWADEPPPYVPVRQPPYDSLGDYDPEKLKIVGTCQEVEKSYFRLTSAPDPATVRPEPVLAQALTDLKRRFRGGGVEYPWLCDQFKAVRQDLVVQHLRTPLTVQVYETHARVALEEGDLNEFNQCQTQLKGLYSDPALRKAGGRQLATSAAEFTAYRVLYFVYLLHGLGGQASGSKDLLSILQVRVWARVVCAVVGCTWGGMGRKGHLMRKSLAWSTFLFLFLFLYQLSSLA